MRKSVQIGNNLVGDESPCFIIGEIGINHNGDLEIAKRLVDTAVLAGCNAVKFQKRTPELCVPDELKSTMRETPWGLMTYLEYRHRIELGLEQYEAIQNYCKERNIPWFASAWDLPSVDFLMRFNPVALKIPSALIVCDDLLRRADACGVPVIVSTGAATMEQIRHAASLISPDRLMPAHTTSTYPCPANEINLRMIETLRRSFDSPIGYSGHEVGLQISQAALLLGANFIERHITLDRALWGSDQSASLEPSGLIKLVRDIRIIEIALGDGIKRVYESEMKSMKRLRPTSATT